MRATYPNPSLPARGRSSYHQLLPLHVAYDMILPIYPSELFSYILRSIRTGIIDNDDLPIQ
jgi:hypothetical protein